MPYTYKGESTHIPDVTGDFCPSCGEVILDATESTRVSMSMMDRHVGLSLDRTKQRFPPLAPTGRGSHHRQGAVDPFTHVTNVRRAVTSDHRPIVGWAQSPTFGGHPV
ncbi:type II toxin-antitoxin system MqsA family antitoxin [Rhodanobacter aciditrophus]|uniref:type II toxin-antitoxin system MqsA family antitoxin n=1 Tax=Rhodanobacter aciditrophus TaxID=1623218 RepID=UPI003CEA4D07